MGSVKYLKQKRYRERNKEKVAANKKRYRLTDEYKIIQGAATKKYGEKIKRRLTDKYIVGLIIAGEKITHAARKEIYNCKPLIEAKRQQILIKRLITNKNK